MKGRSDARRRKPKRSRKVNCRRSHSAVPAQADQTCVGTISASDGTAAASRIRSAAATAHGCLCAPAQGYSEYSHRPTSVRLWLCAHGCSRGSSAGATPVPRQHIGGAAAIGWTGPMRPRTRRGVDACAARSRERHQRGVLGGRADGSAPLGRRRADGRDRRGEVTQERRGGGGRGGQDSLVAGEVDQLGAPPTGAGYSTVLCGTLGYSRVLKGTIQY